MNLSEETSMNNETNQDYNRKMLVDAIAANIYHNIKENNDISKLLAEGMAKSGEDKGTMIQALMGRLLSSPKNSTCHPPNSHLHGSLDTTLDSLTPSGEDRVMSPDASDATLLLDDAKSDFIYHSSCKLQAKEYMGSSGNTPKDQLPLPVAEMGIPVTVQELSNKINNDKQEQKNSFVDFNSAHENVVTVKRASSFNTGRTQTFLNDNKEPEIKRRLSLSSEDKKVYNLPPKPSTTFSGLNGSRGKLQEPTNSNSELNKESGKSDTENLPKPRKFKNLVIRVKSKFNELEKKKWENSSSEKENTEISILQDISNSKIDYNQQQVKEKMETNQTLEINKDKLFEEERCESRLSQRSLSPLSVGPIPVPVPVHSSDHKSITADCDFPPCIREIPITVTANTYTQMQAKENVSEERYQASNHTCAKDSKKEASDSKKVALESKKILEFDTKQFFDKNVTAKPYSTEHPTTITLDHPTPQIEKSTSKEVQECLNCDLRTSDYYGSSKNSSEMRDPSIILLSPTPSHHKKEYLSRSESEKSFEIMGNLCEEVHHVKEDKARTLLNDKLKDSIHDMVAYQKYEETPQAHFQSLKNKQNVCQKDFHEKLYKELTKGTSPKTSFVVEALNSQDSIKNASGLKQCSSVPSHSPETSRRGSQTWQNKSQLWCNSLQRKKQRVKFEEDTPPERPPPPQDQIPPPPHLEQENENLPLPPPRNVIASTVQNSRQNKVEKPVKSGIQTPFKVQIQTPVTAPAQTTVQIQVQPPTPVKILAQAPVLVPVKTPIPVKTSTPDPIPVKTTIPIKTAVSIPAPPARQQSINTMKNLSPITSAYNNALIQTTQAINTANHSEKTLHNQTFYGTAPTSLSSSPAASTCLSDSPTAPTSLSASPTAPTNLSASPTATTWLSNESNTWKNEDPYKKKIDYTLEFGNRKDPWMDFYGKSVLDNTLQDKIETRRSKFTGKQSDKYRSSDEVYEHEAVHSTDRLEKPRNRPGYSSCTLPRKQMNFSANSQGDLKRNSSMSDLHMSPGPSPEPGFKRSWPSSNQIFRREHNSFTSKGGCLPRSESTELKQQLDSRSCTPDMKNNDQNNDIQTNNHRLDHNKQYNNQIQNKEENSNNNQNELEAMEERQINESTSIPLHVVKSVVLSVLAKQGVPNPSDDVINNAIREFYMQQK